MKIGYAKTLTGKLDSVTQETFIDQYAVEKFYVDKISSTSLDAPRLTDMLKSVREGDTVIVNAFSEVAYKMCIRDSVILARGIIGGIDLCIGVFQFLRKIRTITVTDGIRAPLFQNLQDRKSTRLNSSHRSLSRMPSSA